MARTQTSESDAAPTATAPSALMHGRKRRKKIDVRFLHVHEVIVPYLGPPSSRRRDQKPAEPVPVTMPDPETLEQYEQSRKEQIIKILAEALADAMGKKDGVA